MTLRAVLSSFVLLCLWATAARADMGLPMIFVSMQGLLVAIIPIVLIEALILGRGLKIPWLTSIGASALANLASTFVGVPLAWILMVIFEMLTGGGGAEFDSTLEKVLSVTRDAAWIYPYENWQIPAAQLVLLVPFFFASWWIETEIVSHGWNAEVTLSRRVCLRANLVTYSLLAIITVLALRLTLMPTTVLWTYTPEVSKEEFTAFQKAHTEALADIKRLQTAIETGQFVGIDDAGERELRSEEISRVQKTIDCSRFYAINLTITLPEAKPAWDARRQVPVCGYNRTHVESGGRFSWRDTDQGFLGLASGGFPVRQRYMLLLERTIDETEFRLVAIIERP